MWSTYDAIEENIALTERHLWYGALLQGTATDVCKISCKIFHILLPLLWKAPRKPVVHIAVHILDSCEEYGSLPYSISHHSRIDYRSDTYVNITRFH